MSVPSPELRRRVAHGTKVRTALKNLVPDRLFVTAQFRKYHGYWPNLKRPRTFNEHVLVRKLSDDPRAMAPYVDKLAVRDHVARTIGADHLIPLLATYDVAHDIDVTSLPNRFVLKANHGSGFVRLVDTHAPDFDLAALQREASRWLSTDYGLLHRERAYGFVPRRLFSEAFLDSGGGSSPMDIKCYAFTGRVRMLHVDVERRARHRRALFLPDGSPLTVAKNVPRPDFSVTLPANLEHLIGLAEALASPFEFVRVDLYAQRQTALFGELTFYPGAAISPFSDPAFDAELGRVWREGGQIDRSWCAEPSGGRA